MTEYLRQSQNYEFIFNLQKKRAKKASTGNYASWGEGFAAAFAE